MRPTRTKTVTEARYDEGVEAGRIEERAKIVKWLREESARTPASSELWWASMRVNEGAHDKLRAEHPVDPNKR